MADLKFVIFANARSGSTSLAQLLNESKDVKLCMEPFHPKYSEWNSGKRSYSKFIRDPKTMNQALNEIFEKFNAMKVLVYQFPKNIYFAMLVRKDLKIIFLRRKNLAQAALSSLIGQQTNIWHKKDMDSLAYENLKPIKTSEIKRIVNYVSEMNRVYANFLKENRKGDYLNLYYEDYYSENMEENVRNIKKVCNFIQISLLAKRYVEKYMKPSNAKQNQQNLYKKVPNWKEIEKRFPGVFN